MAFLGRTKRIPNRKRTTWSELNSACTMTDVVCRARSSPDLLCDFNFVPSYSIVEASYNIVFGIIGLLTMSVFGGSSLIWLICPTPSVICLPYYLRFLTLFVVFIGGWFGYEIARFVMGYGLFSIYFYGASSFSDSIRFIPFFFYLWCFFWSLGGWLHGVKGFWFWSDRVFWCPGYVVNSGQRPSEQAANGRQKPSYEVV